MGKIFSFEEISLGKIPKKKDFELAESIIREAIHSSPSIVAALIYGSVGKRTYNERSDLDFLIIYENGSRDTISSLGNKVAKEIQNLNVPLQINVLEEKIARTQFHQISPQFYVHLQIAASNPVSLIKKNPLEIIQYINEARIKTVQNYFQNKLRLLEKGSIERAFVSNSQSYEFLSGVIGTALHVCRVICFLYENDPIIDSTNEILQNYELILNKERDFRDSLAEKLYRIIKADRMYTKELNMQLQNPDKERYDKTIADIEAIVPIVLDFVKENIFFVQENYQNSP